MDNTLTKQLGSIGLSGSEVTVYLYLLEHGLSTPPILSRATGITRSNLHYILLGLQTKGFVHKQQKGKRFAYLPSTPSTVLSVLDKKREAMQEIVKDLEALYKTTQQKPIIKFYEGSEQVKEIFQDILASKQKSVMGFASIERLFARIPGNFFSNFGKELKNKEIFLRDILSRQSEKAAQQAQETIGVYYEYRFIDEKDGKDFPTDILVWDNKVAIIILEPEVFATVIENQPLADTYRLQFNFMWKMLPPTH